MGRFKQKKKSFATEKKKAWEKTLRNFEKQRLDGLRIYNKVLWLNQDK